MNHIEAMKQALEALESFAPHNGVFWRNLHKEDAEIAEAITSIRQAIEQAEKQEPVAGDVIYAAWHGAGVDIAGGNWTRFVSMLPPLYTTPPTAQRERVIFPTMLRKMWSGGEVQAWLDENVNKEKNT